LHNSSVINSVTAEKLQQEISDKLIAELSAQAAALTPDENAELAVDWMNGRRTPDANQILEGALTNLSLGSNAPQIFHALVEATCFGAKAIVDRFVEEGIPVKGLIGLGGVAKKSPFIMQMMADIMNMPIRIHKSEQTCALGAAMFAATVAGIYENVEDAMQAMGSGFDVAYNPNKKKVAFYKKRYKKYKKLGVFIEKQV
jgi:L-ribulokinase